MSSHDRHFEPDHAPEHDPDDPDCPCDDCDAIRAQDAADERQAWAQDDRSW